MVGTFMATGLPTPAQAPKVLPAGVIGLVGYANRLLILGYYLWVIVVAREAIKLGSQQTVSRVVQQPSVPRPIFNSFEASSELEPTDPRRGGSAE